MSTIMQSYKGFVDDCMTTKPRDIQIYEKVT